MLGQLQISKKVLLTRLQLGIVGGEAVRLLMQLQLVVVGVWLAAYTPARKVDTNCLSVCCIHF